MNNDSQTAETSAAETTAQVETTTTTPEVTAQSGSLLTSGEAPAVQSPTQEVTQEATKAEEQPQGAPEKYADFTMPEGVKADIELVSEFAAFAKEKNLSQEEAQKFADMGAKVAQKTRETFSKQIEAIQTQWVSESRADKEFGGDKLSENMAVAKKAIDAFGSPELTKMLNESGLGNHPEVIRAFYRVGQAISEDRLVPGGKAVSVDPYAKMYPSMVK